MALAATVFLAGCDQPRVPYTAEQTRAALDECSTYELGVWWEVRSYDGKIVGHQCGPAVLTGAPR